MTLNPETEVIATLGSKEGLANLAMAITAPGDVILAPNPSYPIHPYGFMIAGAALRHIPALGEGGVFDPEAYLRALDRAVRHSVPTPICLIVNFPSNPTAQVCDLDFYAEIVRFAKEHDIAILSDLAYSEIYFEGTAPPPSILQAPGARDIAVEFTSLSKTYSMPGWRMGFAVGSERLIGALTRIKSYLDYGAFTPVQVAAAAALNGPQDCVDEIRGVYQGRRDALVSSMAQAGWDIPPPPATMFAWAPVPEPFRALGSMEFAKLLLQEAEVAVSPGVGFGEYGEGFVRIGLVENEQRIRQAARNVKRLMQSADEVLSRYSQLARSDQADWRGYQADWRGDQAALFLIRWRLGGQGGEIDRIAERRDQPQNLRAHRFGNSVAAARDAFVETGALAAAGGHRLRERVRRKALGAELRYEAPRKGARTADDVALVRDPDRLDGAERFEPLPCHQELNVPMRHPARELLYPGFERRGEIAVAQTVVEEEIIEARVFDVLAEPHDHVVQADQAVENVPRRDDGPDAIMRELPAEIGRRAHVVLRHEPLSRKAPERQRQLIELLLSQVRPEHRAGGQRMTRGGQGSRGRLQRVRQDGRQKRRGGFRRARQQNARLISRLHRQPRAQKRDRELLGRDAQFLTLVLGQVRREERMRLRGLCGDEQPALWWDARQCGFDGFVHIPWVRNLSDLGLEIRQIKFVVGHSAFLRGVCAFLRAEAMVARRA